MKKMSRSNAECRQILRNGKPPDLRNKSLLMPLSILSKTDSHGVVKGGGQDFWTNKIFLITVSQWNKRPFCTGHTDGGVLVYFYVDNYMVNL